MKGYFELSVFDIFSFLMQVVFKYPLRYRHWQFLQSAVSDQDLHYLQNTMGISPSDKIKITKLLYKQYHPVLGTDESTRHSIGVLNKSI